MRKGDFSTAAQDWSAIIELDPSNVKGYKGRVSTLYMAGDRKAALATLASALRVAPSDGELHYLRGFMKYEVDDFAGAETDYGVATRCGYTSADFYPPVRKMRYTRPMNVSINTEKIARDVIVVGASAGGIRAVVEMLSRLPADLQAFVGVVIHRGADSTSDWSDVLGMKTNLRVVEPTHGDPLTRGFVYLAPADCHMTFEHDSVVLDGGVKEHHTRPAVDPLFASAALAYGPRVVGVVLTGGGHDGMQGLLDVTTAGGLSLVQKPSEAEQPSMPAYAIAHDHVRAALTVDALGDALVLLARGSAVSIDGSEAPRV